ncbi:MAG TPA: K(+)-transporting ATPase subunit C [Bacillota bacterium]|nr:K(+)-transporting ATPase subunit C [Bacillota bacterium]
MRETARLLRPAFFSFLILTLLCGVIYPGFVTVAGQLFYPSQANGSIITVTLQDGTKKTYGSELIAQEFTKPEYLIGRPSGTSNLSPVSEKQEKLVKERIEWWHQFDPDNLANIPMDLVTASGSGVDPNISPQAAEYQVARIAKARGISEKTTREIIVKYTTGKFLGIWGEEAVNVLKVNLALDGLL